MNIAGILAGGSGTRMGKTDLPKQFLLLGDRPIIIHTLDQFIISPYIDKIVVAVPENWLNYTKDIVEKYCYSNDIDIICGGHDRNSTIMNVCNYIKDKYKSNEDINVITHDAVRPFITQRIIKDNVEGCIKYGATDTVIPADDTIVESINGKLISNIPIRDNMYQGQTPQSFKLKEFIEINDNLTEEEKKLLTDASKVYVIKNKEVALVAGEKYNLKITTKYDLKIANLLLGNIEQEGENDD